MSDETEPPALPGEVARGESADGITVAIAGDPPLGWFWSEVYARWQRDPDGDPYAVLFMAERARAEKAEAIAAAERAVRRAAETAEDERLDLAALREEGGVDGEQALVVERAEDAVDAARAALRALGVEP